MPRILLATDGSLHALNAVKYTGFMFKEKDVDILIIHVLPSLPPILTERKLGDRDFVNWQIDQREKWIKKHEENANRILNEAKETLLRLGIKEERVGTEVYFGRSTAARDLIFYFRGGAFDAAVLGRRGLSKIEELIMGSVSERIVHAGDIPPVWIVTGAVDSKKMLIPVDGSAHAERAVEHAGLMVAGIPDVSINLFHVLSEKYLEYGEDLGTEYWSTWTKERKKTIASFLDKAKEMLLSIGIPENAISTTFKEGGDTAKEILKAQKEGGYGTIVMGKRGLSGIKEFIGSVSKKVLTHVNNCAVWLVR